MTGNELFQKLSQRDYSGNVSDNYAQLLSTIFLHLSNSNEIENFYSFLAMADNENKNLLK